MAVLPFLADVPDPEHHHLRRPDLVTQLVAADEKPAHLAGLVPVELLAERRDAGPAKRPRKRTRG